MKIHETVSRRELVLDWEPVHSALSAHALPEDMQLVKSCLCTTIDNWLADDYEELDITGVEEHLEIPRMKGYLDLNARFKGVSPSRGTTAAAEAKLRIGKKVIVDWKTSWGPLDARWKRRYIRDWQWRIYSYLQDADYFWFRGISANPFTETPVMDCLLEVTPEVKSSAKQFLEQMFGLRDTLIQLGSTPWPRFWPCKSESFSCPYEDDCLNLREFPGNLSSDKIMSYSRWREFTSCPEMHRRRGITNDEGEGERVTQFGIAIHAGLAEVYKQVFER